MPPPGLIRGCWMPCCRFLVNALATRAAPVTVTVGKPVRRSMWRGDRLRRQSAPNREKSCSPAARRKATIWRCAAWRSGRNCGMPNPRRISSASPPSTKPMLDPLEFLGRRGCEITLLSVEQAGSPSAGLISAQHVADAIRENTVLVSVMLANNEIGAIQPIAEIGAICRQRGMLLHCDATQGGGQNSCRCRQVARRFNELFRTQNLRTKRHWRTVCSAQCPGGEVRAADFRRRSGEWLPQRNRQRAGHCRVCEGARAVYR